jgi:hypothetical protein
MFGYMAEQAVWRNTNVACFAEQEGIFDVVNEIHCEEIWTDGMKELCEEIWTEEIWTEGMKEHTYLYFEKGL